MKNHDKIIVSIMKKIILSIVLTSLFFIIGIISYMVISQLLSYQDFACPGVTGFTFSYPVFKDWEVKGIVSEKEGSCTIFFKHPNGILYEIPPQITVEKTSELGQKFMIEKLRGGKPSEEILDDSGMKFIGIMSAKVKNPAAIPYEYVPDPTMYIEGHVFKKGEWDWLVFYGQDFGVRISRSTFGSLGFIEEAERKGIHEFDSDVFYKNIIQTFVFQ